MRIRNTVFVILFAFGASNFIFGQCWDWQNPKPDGLYLYDVHFPTTNTGYYCGDKGVVGKSTDKGQSWTDLTNTNTTLGLSGIWFADDQTGWAVGANGIIIHTKDGGISWSKQVSGTPQTLFSVCFPDAQTGFAVGGGGTILKTDDSGNSWTAQTPVNTVINKVYFITTQEGWAVGRGGVILHTNDGGQNWEQQDSKTTADLESVYFKSASSGWAVGVGGITLRTSNGGSTWNSNTISGGPWLQSVYFTNAITGYAVGSGTSGGILYKTITGGDTWTEVSAFPNSNGFLNAMHFSDTQTGHIVGWGRTIIRTTDDGTNWNLYNSVAANYLWRMFFTDKNNGWAISNKGTVVHTSDGQNWSKQNSGSTNDLSSLWFIDASNGWVGGGQGTLLKTTNGGTNWQKVNVGGVSGTLTNILFINNQVGWFTELTSSTNFYQTTDGGQSWSKLTNRSENISAIWFTDANTGWASAYFGGKLLKSTDGGKNWADVNTGSAEGYLDIHFINSQVGWIAGSNTIKKTTNGGQTWTQQFKGSSFLARNIHMVNESTGWIVGDAGVIMRTPDGGAHWIKQKTIPSVNQLGGLYAVDNENAWISGTNGAILKHRLSKPGCPAALHVPSNNSSNVSVGITLRWRKPENTCVDGYFLSLGTTSGSTDLVGNIKIIEDTIWKPSKPLPYNTKIFVNITPFYDNLSAPPCAEYSFTTQTDPNANTAINGCWSAQALNVTNEDLNDVFFIDNQTGWAVGDNSIVLKTTDGGKLWTNTIIPPQPSPANLLSIYFLNANIGWAVGFNGSIFKTTDGGTNWTKQNISESVSIHSVYFLDTENGWVSGAGGLLYKTTDGGTTWIKVASNSSTTLSAVQFLYPQKGFAIVDNATQSLFLKTTDNGNTWNTAIQPVISTLNDLYFKDIATGWAVGSNGGVTKTTDGGNNWATLTTSSPELLTSVYFTDTKNGWVVGNNGTILITKDGGSIWEKQNVGVTQNLKSIHFADPKNGWAVGENGTVLKFGQNPPECIPLNGPIIPAPNSTNVSVNTSVTWPGASTGCPSTGYKITVGTSSGGSEIVNNFDNGSSTVWKPANALPANSTIFVKVVAYNAAGDASGCGEFSFVTENVGCRTTDSLELVKLYNATNGANWTNKWDLTKPMDTWFGVTLNAGGCVTRLELGNNNLKGNLIDFDIPNLQYFYCNNNSLSGIIPDFSKLPNLIEFSCKSNQLDGSIPNFSNLPNLRDFWCYGNLLSGSIPDFSKLPKLQTFDCNGNLLSGSIPDFSNLPNLQRFRCYNNKLSGSIPDFSKLPNLQEFYSNNNALSGNIPNFILPNLNKLFLNDNQLSGSIPNFSNMPVVLSIDLSNNQLTGNIPNFTNLDSLQLFNCSANQLSGSIPNFDLPKLVVFSCFLNQLSGNIPNFNLPNLTDFYCAFNQLSGDISDLNLPKLGDFRANNNKISGLVQFTKMPTLTTNTFPEDSLTLYSNKLTFDDIIPNISLINNMNGRAKYAPQDSIFSDTLITRNAGEALTIDLGIDASLTSNIYEWTKDNTVIVPPAPNTSNSNKLIFKSLKASDTGNYYVKVTNPNASDLTLHSRRLRLVVGCTTGSATLITKSICQGQTFPFNNQNLSVAGIYKDTLTAANGCDSILSLTLSVSPAPMPKIGATGMFSLCPNEQVALNPGTFKSYLWSSGATTQFFTVTAVTATYTVTVTDNNGCTATASASVTALPKPNPQFSNNGILSVCNGSQLTLDPGSFKDYQWNTNAITPTITVGAIAATYTVTVSDNNGCSGVATAQVSVSPKPNPQFTNNGILSLCPGAEATLNPGTFKSYAWDNGSTTQTLLVASFTKTYTVTVTDNNTCTATATAQVTALTPPDPSFGPSNVFALCPGQSVTLNPGGTFKQYAWSIGVSTSTLMVPSTPQVYTVTVTDNNNCTASVTASVTELPKLGIAIAAPDTLDCTKNQIILDGSGSASGALISYNWTTTNGQIISGATTNKATIGKPGNYQLVVSGPANTCSNTLSVLVLEQKQTASDAVLDLKDPSCKGLADGSMQVGVITGGLGPFAYSLNGGTFVNTKTFPNLAPGSYALTIRGRNGCDFVKNFSIKEGTGPQPGISDQTVCPGVSATFDGGNFVKWQWSNNSSQKTISVTQPGTYTITVTDTKGCTGTDEAVLQNHPAVIAAATSADSLTCSKAQVTLNSAGSSAGAGITYTWTTTNGNILSGANTASPTVNKGGTYQLVVQNSQTTCSSSITTTVIEKGKQITGIDLQVVDIKCFADSNGQIIVEAVGTGAAPFTYKLNNGGFQNGDEFDQLKPGTYALTVRGADGCEAQASATIKAPAKISVAITAPTGKLSPGENAKLSTNVAGAQGAVAYAWEGPSLSCTDCAEPSVSPIFLSRYMLTVTDAQGCTAAAFAIVDVESDKGQDIITPDGDGLNDGLEFEELNMEPAKSKNDIIIFNRWGQPVYTAKPYANEWIGKDKSGNELPEGSYYYVLTLRDGKKDVIYGSVLIVR